MSDPLNHPAFLESVRTVYTKEDFEMAADCLRRNNYRLGAAFGCVQYGKPDWDAEFIVRLLEELDHLRRGEPLGDSYTANAITEWGIHF